jgi:hypothetical protein
MPNPVRPRLLPTTLIVVLMLYLTQGAPNAPAETCFDVTYELDVPTAVRTSFNQAAAGWSALLNDPVTVKIDVGWDDELGSWTLGEASTWVAYGDYNAVRNLVAGGGEPGDTREESLLPALPTASQFVVDLPPGFAFDGTTFISTANYKALGGPYAGPDGSINFSSTFPWDFDPSDGIDEGHYDFHGVAQHEIGHILGFLSGLKDVDYALHQGSTIDDVWVSGLDLFRFDTTDLDGDFDFTTTPRNLTPGGSHSFYHGDDSILMSTGTYNGDGMQGSHWKDNLGLGIMDPTMMAGECVEIGPNDLIAFDLLGWDVVPEPSTLVLTLTGLLAIAFLARRRRP